MLCFRRGSNRHFIQAVCNETIASMLQRTIPSAGTRVFTIATVVAEHEKNGPVIIFVTCQHLNA
jgi:hypothetical protein